MAGGKHLVFSSFSKNMDKLPDVNETVMQCATFLCESKDINKGSWQVFSQQFFRYYRKTILAYYGYEEAEFQVPLKKVIKPFFFLPSCLPCMKSVCSIALCRDWLIRSIYHLILGKCVLLADARFMIFSLNTSFFLIILRI